MLANVTNALMQVVHTDYERVESTCVFMCLFVNVETREVIATRKATRNRYENENERERGEIRGEWNSRRRINIPC